MTMFYRQLGSTGMQVSALGFGTVKLGRSEGVKYPHAFHIPDDNEARALLALAREVGRELGQAHTRQPQFDALVSFAYNLGATALARSTLLALHRAGDFTGAAAQFARWNRQGKVVLAGLSRRRAAEAALYRTAA